MNRSYNIRKILNNPKNIIMGSLGFFFGVGFIFLLSLYTQIIISETDSLPKHYFLHFTFCKPGLKDHTLLYSKWYGKKIIKQIVGVEGDKVWYDKEKCLWVNQHKVGFIKSTSKDKRTLTPIKSQVIPKGYVFVYSDHTSSFDSRYQELGLVPVAILERKVIPLL